MAREWDFGALKNPVFWVAILLFVCGVVLSFLNRTGGSFLTYGAALFCLFFVYLPQFEWFKGFGLQGKLREKLGEADVLIQRLRSISVLIAETLFTLMARMGRLGPTIPRRTSYRIMKQFENELRTNGVSSDEIEAAKRDWHRFVMFDLAYEPVLKRIDELLREKIRAKDGEVTSYRSPIDASDATYKKIVDERNQMYACQKRIKDLYDLEKVQGLNAGTIEALVNDCPAFREDEKKALLSDMRPEIEDLDFYAKNHEFRRLEKWLEEG